MSPQPETTPFPPDYLAKITGHSRSGNPIQGSGIQITPTLILTCKHVLEPQGESGPPSSVQILIANKTLTAHPLEPANPNHHWDLVLLQIQGDPLPPPERAWKWEPTAKQNIPLLGFPKGEYKKPTAWPFRRSPASVLPTRNSSARRRKRYLRRVGYVPAKGQGPGKRNA